MRSLAIASLLVLGACSEGGGEKKASEADKTKLELATGQWQAASEVTAMRKQDKGAPAMKADKGTKMEVKACVAQGEGKKPPAALLAGVENATCTYQNIYMSRGKINASMVCRRPGLDGQLLVSTNGTYTDKSFDLTSTVNTLLAGEGDISFDSKVTGRHAGTCTSGAAGK
jgi:hypothetical protein